MVFEFCCKCEVLVMRRRERLLANVSLMLLASCCLVICTDQSREGGDGDTPETINGYATDSVLDRSAAAELRREADVLRIASELCARFPDKCRQVSDNDEVLSQKSVALRGMDQDTRTQSLALKRIYGLFKAEQEERQLISGTNLTSGQRMADEFGVWRGPIQSAGAVEGSRQTNLNDATRSDQQEDEIRSGVKIKQRGLRDPQRSGAKMRPTGRIRQRWQQSNMDQHIVEALPSAFAFTGRPPLEGGRGSARSRSTRQQRSDDEQQQQQQQQQLSLPRQWVDLDGTGREAARNQYSSTTTNSHKISQRSSLDEEALQCSVKQFSFTATKTDDDGNSCSGEVRASICYGGCDTGEIADWLFPGKKSIHKVCRHGRRIRRRILLNDCSSKSIGPDNPLRVYHYVDAHDCVCKKCSSVDTTCLGTMSRPYLQTPQSAITDEPSGANDGGGGGDD